MHAEIAFEGSLSLPAHTASGAEIPRRVSEGTIGSRGGYATIRDHSAPLGGYAAQGGRKTLGNAKWSIPFIRLRCRTYKALKVTEELGVWIFVFM